MGTESQRAFQEPVWVAESIPLVVLSHSCISTNDVERGDVGKAGFRCERAIGEVPSNGCRGSPLSSTGQLDPATLLMSHNDLQ